MSGRVAILSVREPWASMLLDGRKSIELRKRTSTALANCPAVIWQTARPVRVLPPSFRPPRSWRWLRDAERAAFEQYFAALAEM